MRLVYVWEVLAGALFPLLCFFVSVAGLFSGLFLPQFEERESAAVRSVGRSILELGWLFLIFPTF